jgi:alkane 1-monooxygenase
MNRRELIHGSGYLLILVPPVLLVLSAALNLPALPFICLILVAPLLRLVLGDAPTQPLWSEVAASVLEIVPMAAAVAFLTSVVYIAWAMGQQDLEWQDWLQYGLSLWAVAIFSSCYAHELLHRQRAPVSRMLGRLVSGAMGYPLLEHEHREHHGHSTDVVEADWAPVGESLWHYTGRRFKRVSQEAWEGDQLAAAKNGHRLAGGLPLAVAAMLLTCIVFCVAAGLPALIMYAAVAAGVAWTMQAMTYVQHWGLGPDAAPNARSGDYAWEDGCRLQAWLSLCISYHQAHHHHATVPYYRRELVAGSPRQPAGYVVLLFAAMVPPLWRSLMLPALEAWQRDPCRQESAGRRLICFKRGAGGA